MFYDFIIENKRNTFQVKCNIFRSDKRKLKLNLKLCIINIVIILGLKIHEQHFAIDRVDCSWLILFWSITVKLCPQLQW